MKRLILAALLSMSLSGCSMLLPLAKDVLGGASKDGISAEAQIGDRENNVGLDSSTGAGDIKASDSSQVSVSSTNTDANISQAGRVSVTNIPFWVLLILLLGWILPTPSSLWKGIKDLWRRRLQQQQ